MTTKHFFGHSVFFTFLLCILSSPVNAHLDYDPHGVMEALDKGKRDLMEKYGNSVFGLYADLSATITTKAGKVNEKVSKSIGATWVARSDGYLVTVYHVLDTSDDRAKFSADIKKRYDALPIREKVDIDFTVKYYIANSQKQKLPVKIIAQDADNDLALLHLDGKWGLPLRAIPLGEYEKHPYGSVVSIGTPRGIPDMVTDGALAHKSLRDCDILKGGYLLFISSVTHGNSGGPTILRETTELMAMVDAIVYGQDGNPTGISCGIPSSTIRRFLDKNLPPLSK